MYVLRDQDLLYHYVEKLYFNTIQGLLGSENYVKSLISDTITLHRKNNQH